MTVTTKSQEIVIEPQLGPQTMFLTTPADIAGYGGAVSRLFYGGAVRGGYKCAIISSRMLCNKKELIMHAIVYGMADPRTQGVRYVGRTIQLLSIRLCQHIDFARRKKSTCARAIWIRSLLAIGLKPQIFEIERVSLEASPEAEGKWISHLRSLGADLLNEQSHNVGGSKSYVVDWTPDKIEKLGKVSDSDLAIEFGIDRKSVEYKRKSLGIPRKPQMNFVVPPMGGWNRIELPDHIIARFGTVSDRQLGQEIGVSKWVIQRAREKRSIPAWTEINNHPTRYHTGHKPTRWDKERG